MTVGNVEIQILCLPHPLAIKFLLDALKSISVLVVHTQYLEAIFDYVKHSFSQLKRNNL